LSEDGWDREEGGESSLTEMPLEAAGGTGNENEKKQLQE